MKRSILFAGPGDEYAKKAIEAIGYNAYIPEIDLLKWKESGARIPVAVREQNVYLIMSTAINPQESYFNLLCIINALKKSSPASITVIMPAMGFVIDNTDTIRTPLILALMMKFITKAGADKVFTIDLHMKNYNEFNDTRIENIRASLFFTNDIMLRFNSAEIILVPLRKDDGPRAKVFHKSFPEAERASVNSSGEIFAKVVGKKAIVIGDIDCGEDFVARAVSLKKAGAVEVHGYITHFISKPNSKTIISNESITSLTVSDALPIDFTSEKMRIVSSANLLGRLIRVFDSGGSMDEVGKILSPK